ncbi:MAG: hypothetical protein NC223_11695 [Butyrivibrio sp.]|nr:hypothetical protein [Butyrivibrio sp.]
MKNKKNLRFLASITAVASIAIIICFSIGVNTYAGYEKDTKDLVYYQITPNDPEWSNFQTTEEMYDACQIDIEILKDMSTAELAEAVADYPLMINVYAYDSMEQGLESLRRHFDGLDELLKRSDTINGICLYLENISDKETARKLDEDFGLKCDYCMALIDYTYQKQNYISYDDSKKIMNVYKQIKSLSDDGLVSEGCISFDYLHDLSIENSLNGMSKSVPSRDVIDPDISINVKKVGTKTVYTPKGTAMTLTQYEFVSSYAASYINKQMDAAYPNAERLGTATAHYNCHSYAWYSTSLNNTCWMEPSQAMLYITDGSYSSVSNFSNIVGAKVRYTDTYGDFVHSAIVYSQSSTNRSSLEQGIGLVVKSKWGRSGLYKHNASYSPYDIGTLTFYK